MAGVRAVVEAVQAAPPRTGLVATVRAIVGDVAAGDDGRWAAGLSVSPEACAAGGVVDPCAPGTLTIAAAEAQVDVDPVLLWGGERCSPADRRRDFAARARRQLEACTSKLLADELWHGTLAASAGFPNAALATNDANTVTSGATPAVDGLACLEDALADCGCGRGIIHATPGTATWWAHLGLVARDGGVLRTINDTVVIADAGYDGTGPDGQVASSGHVWAYATNIVNVRLSPIRVVPDTEAEALNRSVNLFEYRAVREAAAWWEGCCHLAAELDLSVCGNPGGS